MAGIVLYQSKYGAAKQYAEWLSEETGFPCAEVKKFRAGELARYDTVILGGGIYASGIAGLSFLKKHMDALRGKKLAVFCCGASPYEEGAFQEIVRRNMTGKLAEVPCFYFRGAWDMSAMSFKDRALCGLLRKAVAKKDPADYEVWEKALMAAGEAACDWTDRANLQPLLDFLR